MKISYVNSDVDFEVPAQRDQFLLGPASDKLVSRRESPSL